MKTILHANTVTVSGINAHGLVVEANMTERQMYDALNQFLHHVSDETWTDWQLRINKEIYGSEPTDSQRYQFLKEFYALNDSDCESAFKRLAFMSGAEFDAEVDKAMKQGVAA